MANEAREDGWVLNQNDFQNDADRPNTGLRRRYDNVETSLDDGGLSVTIEGGYSYESYTAGVTIPMDILISMLNHAGYDVTRRSSGQ